MRLPLGHFGVLWPLNQLTEEEFSLLAGVLVLITEGRIGFSHTVESRRGNLESGDFLGYFLVRPFPVVRINGKLHQPEKGRKTNDSDLLRMKVWVTLPVEELREIEIVSSLQLQFESLSFFFLTLSGLCLIFGSTSNMVIATF